MLHVFPTCVLIQQCNKKLSLFLVPILLKVYGVDWSCNRQLDQFLSASWDHSIKLVSIGNMTKSSPIWFVIKWVGHTLGQFKSDLYKYDYGQNWTTHCPVPN